MRPTQALQVLRYRRIPITTKDVNKGFYKGNRTGAMGWHTKYGGYKIDWNKVRTYIVPEQQKLAACRLTPFVSREIKPAVGRFEGSTKGPLDPEWYIRKWRKHNHFD